MLQRQFWVFVLFLVTAETGSALAAVSFEVLHSFSLPGLQPRSALIRGTDGALYGTTEKGGEKGRGTIFKVNPDGTGFQVLHDFAGSVTDGGTPRAGLIQASNGALYGTTSSGGFGNSGGTVFKINMDGTSFQLLHRFDDEDGLGPQGELIQGLDGALYGTATTGGGSGAGTVFKLNLDGGGFEVLHRFQSSDTSRNPLSALIQGNDNALYGTTPGHGNGISRFDYGTVFKVNTDGTGFQVLHTFAGNDGFNPESALILANDGILYGTTVQGGDFDDGTVFKLNPDGTGFGIIYHFEYNGIGLFDGTSPIWPSSALRQDLDGALYGTSEWGLHHRGTVFKLNTDGTEFEVLYDFDTGDGDSPHAALLQDADGIFYGTTYEGGAGDLKHWGHKALGS